MLMVVALKICKVVYNFMGNCPIEVGKWDGSFFNIFEDLQGSLQFHGQLSD